MLRDVQRQQLVGAGIMPEVGRRADQRTPRRYPLPECLLRVALQSPRLGVAPVVDEKLGQHFRLRADAEEFGMCA